MPNFDNPKWCGLSKWPDWTGETAVIVGTGLGATVEPLEKVRGFARFVVIKESWKLAPWADILYGIDRGWWIATQGAKDFTGMKVSPSPTVCRLYNINLVKLKPRSMVLTKEVGVLGCGLPTGGGHSGFQAINLAVQFGVRRIVLVGFDMLFNRQHPHWHAEGNGVGKADANRITSWREALDGCAQQFKDLGVTVNNATPDSALKEYPKMSLAQAVFA